MSGKEIIFGKKSRFKFTIEAAQIITPFAEGGIFSSIGNKPAKLHIDHNGRIAGWDRDSALNAKRQIGFQNCIVGPGFIDLHFHGYGDQSNVQYSEIGSFQNPVRILEKITTYGTTACLATVLVPVQSRRFFGVDLDARFKMLRTELADLARKTPPYHPPRAKLLGMHFEGPKINPEVSGAIPPNSIWQVSKRDLPRIIGEEEAGNADHGVRMITIAPEMDFSSDFSCIRALSERGIVVALGHSSATLEQTIAAIYAGARHFTHLYNSMGFLFHRNPGIVGAGLVDPRIYNAQGLGTGVVINGHPISCIEDIASDYYIHLRQAIHNVHEGLPTLLHQTVLINRLIAKGELALMRTCDDEFPELHLESLVSVGGIIHYGREEEKRAGKIFFRKDKINTLIETFETDPYLYENTTFELDLSVKDIIDAFGGKAEENEHAAAVFKRVGMALGSGIFSLTNTLDTPIRHIVILPQMGSDLSKAFDIIKQTIITTLTSGVRDEKGWDVSFIKGDEKLYVLAGACMCYK